MLLLLSSLFSYRSVYLLSLAFACVRFSLHAFPRCVIPFALEYVSPHIQFATWVRPVTGSEQRSGLMRVVDVEFYEQLSGSLGRRPVDKMFTHSNAC